MIWVFLILFSLFSCAPKTGDTGSLKWQYNYDLGMSSYMAKNYSEAIANFYKASQLAPNEPKVWNALGLAYTEVQEYQKAETAYLKALEIDKKYTEARMNLGILYFKQERYERSIEALKQVLEDEAFPQKHMAFYYLGKVYQSMGNHREYINNLRKATAYNPMFIDAQIELAQAYEKEEDYIQARSIYISLINNGINNPNLDLSMARVEYKLGNYTTAKSYIKKVLEDKRASSQLKSQAYDLLSEVLIAEQARTVLLRTDKPAQREKPQESLPKPQEVIPKPQENIPALQPAFREMPPQEIQTRQRVYRIQVGAFSSVQLARSWKERLERELNLKDISVVEASGVFRVFYGSFNTREDAQKELSRLRGMNIYGFIVQE